MTGRAQYLLLFHELTDAPGMCINGRVWLGNRPTFLGGPETVMRFHTFHLHGHRWTLTGPDGTDTGSIQGSPQVRAVSQFDDAPTFGPANSFAFTIREGARIMGAPPEPAAGATRPGSLGEWHMTGGEPVPVAHDDQDVRRSRCGAVDEHMVRRAFNAGKVRVAP